MTGKTLPPGTKLGPYEILSPLGAGGMGEVYRARDPRLAREVAVKILPESFASDADRLRRFEQEARAVGALNHPNILSVHDIGAQGGTHYIVTELLEGETLRDLLGNPKIENGNSKIESRKSKIARDPNFEFRVSNFASQGRAPLQINKLLNIAVQIAHGLSAAHEKSIVHGPPQSQAFNFGQYARKSPLNPRHSKMERCS
jgi:serine/threonine protein kinase